MKLRPEVPGDTSENSNISTILIADDNSKALEAIQAFLESCGHRVITAQDGRQAVESADEYRPDLILLDINMPVMDGYEASKKIIHELGMTTTPIVFLSGRKEVSDRIRALQAGAIDYLTKPVHGEELRIRVESLLKLKAYNEFVAGHREHLKVELAESSTALQAAVEAYSRFVPVEFLELLDKKSVIDVHPGDQILREMTILFSDIRSFTSLSEKMTPQENFNFLNSYLSRMDPFIWNNGGFIDKYIGDSIMALFPDGAESAVRAAIEMIRYLPVYNSQRRNFGYDALRIGIGLHTGPVMLGTIGNERFMQCTVISHNVNLAARLEGLTKEYGATIVVSNAVLFGLTDPSRFCCRFLDKIQLKGITESVSVFEIFDGDSPAQKEQKLKTQSDFEKAVFLYHTDFVSEAYELFIKIQEKSNLDMACKVYVNRCEFFQKHGRKMRNAAFISKRI